MLSLALFSHSCTTFSSSSFLSRCCRIICLPLPPRSTSHLLPRRMCPCSIGGGETEGPPHLILLLPPTASCEMSPLPSPAKMGAVGSVGWSVGFARLIFGRMCVCVHCVGWKRRRGTISAFIFRHSCATAVRRAFFAIIPLLLHSTKKPCSYMANNCFTSTLLRPGRTYSFVKGPYPERIPYETRRVLYIKICKGKGGENIVLLGYRGGIPIAVDMRQRAPSTYRQTAQKRAGRVLSSPAGNRGGRRKATK